MKQYLLHHRAKIPRPSSLPLIQLLYVCNKETHGGKNITRQEGKIDQYFYFLLRVENKKKASFNSQVCKTDLCKLCPEQHISYL